MDGLISILTLPKTATSSPKIAHLTSTPLRDPNVLNSSIAKALLKSRNLTMWVVHTVFPPRNR